MPQVLMGSKYDQVNDGELDKRDTIEATVSLGTAGSSETGEASLHLILIYFWASMNGYC